MDVYTKVLRLIDSKGIIGLVFLEISKDYYGSIKIEEHTRYYLIDKSDHWKPIKPEIFNKKFVELHHELLERLELKVKSS